MSKNKEKFETLTLLVGSLVILGEIRPSFSVRVAGYNWNYVGVSKKVSQES